MLKNVKISQKIYILGFTQLLLMLFIGGIALTQMSKIGAELIDIAEKDIPLTNSVTLLTEHQLEQSIFIERALFNAALMKQNIHGAEKHLDEITHEVTELAEKIIDEISAIKSFVDNSIDDLHTEEAKQEFKKLSNSINIIQSDVVAFDRDIIAFLLKIKTASLNDIALNATTLEHTEDKIQHEVVALLTEVQKFTLHAALQAEHDEQEGVKWITIAFVIALVIGLFLPYVIGRAITKPINELSSRLEEVANGDGDLTVVLSEKAKDETGDVARAFNKFLSTLRTLISTTNTQANVLGESSEFAMSEMRVTVSNVEKQRAETEMVAAAVNEMSATSHDVAQNAASAAKVTETVKEKVTSGQQGALETQAIIKQLSGEVTDASSVIQNLVQETNNIGNVLESIQGIAAQTNLLALNAAIEAARAGETGRGFAVVADEVRTLAQRTQTSTVDIQELLLRLKSEANNAVISMDKGTESANACLEKSAYTSQVFEEAAASVMTISDLNMEIATAAEQQSQVAEEVNQNLVNISELADVTLGGAEQTSKANLEMTKQIDELHNNLSAFNV